MFPNTVLAGLDPAISSPMPKQDSRVNPANDEE
jgi:hypothetical protein